MKRLATLTLIAGVSLGDVAATRAEPVPVPAYLPYDDAMQVPFTDWERPYDDAGYALLAAAPPYLSPLPPGAPSSSPAAATGTTTAARRSRYPRAELDRPAVLPLGVVIASLDAATVPATGPHPEHVAARPEIAGGLPYRRELRVSYAQPLGGDDGPRWLAARTGTRLWGNPWLVVSTRSTLTYDAGGRRFGVSSSGVRIAATVGRVGVVVQPEQLTFDLGGDTPPQLAVPLAAGVQVTPILWMHAETAWRVAELVDDRLVRRDPGPLPVGLAAIASVAPRLDLRATITGDVRRDGVVTSSVGWSLGLAYIFGG
jgi:hypothetical protein